MHPRLLPLFPLPLVLFPRAPLPLHIFEPRYRQLLADCLSSDRQFGVICHPESQAERGIELGTVGCVARIETAEQLPDGRSNILVSGGDRFRVLRLTPGATPYHIGEVDAYDDHPEPTAMLDPLADRLRDVFQRVGRSARAIADDASPLPELPEDPAAVSFSVAQYIDLDLEIKQELLTSRSPADRLRQLTELLDDVVPRIEQRAARHLRARGNGQGPHVEAG
ncbi:MAG TPA: LON peptidase substrate-binding domain-containing protein [Gemmatimonadaceae bacterium]|nr:LON peptidase substrate-binding domain-containing protein [Gemmatimonadaceae bacterium]